MQNMEPQNHWVGIQKMVHGSMSILIVHGITSKGDVTLHGSGVHPMFVKESSLPFGTMPSA